MTVPVRQAASVLLLRPGTDSGTGNSESLPAASTAPEILTITRSRELVFSAGVTAFPGGRIDDTDHLAVPAWGGTDLPDWGQRLGLGPDAAGKLLAGVVRETFEETGILLARHRDGTPVDPGFVASLPEETRRRIELHELDFGALLAGHGLVPEVGRMRPLSRWITPPGPPRRYDTYFFAAALPDGQVPGTLSFEGTSSQWTTAAGAREDFRAGRHQLMPPTWAQLYTLAPARSVEDALAVEGQLEAVRPTVAPGPDGTVTGFHGDTEFADDLAVHRRNAPPAARD